jgi:hypothetical protein
VALQDSPEVADVRGKTATISEGEHQIHAFADGKTVKAVRSGKRVVLSVGNKPMTELRKGPLCYDCECGIDCPLTPGHCVRVDCSPEGPTD